MLATLLVLAVTGCAAGRGEAGFYTGDARCIREKQVSAANLRVAVHECGMLVPDLTNDPDLQRLAAVEGQPYLATRRGHDGFDHWFLCRLTGLAPGNEPSRSSPFRCASIHVESRPVTASSGD